MSFMWPWMIAGALLAAPPEVEVKTLAGKQLSGQLVELSPRQLTLTLDGQAVALPVSELASLYVSKREPSAERISGMTVTLVDQSVIRATDYRSNQATARLQLADQNVLEVPTKLIRSILFANHPEGEQKLAGQWSNIVANKAAADVLVLRKGGSLDYLEGVLGDVDQDIVKFQLDAEVIPVKRAKIEGLVYYHPQHSDIESAAYEVTTADGWRLRAQSVALSGGKLQIKTTAGLSVERPLEALAAIDFSAGKIQYLSDLEPEATKFTPYFGLKRELPSLTAFYQPRRDKGFEQNPLRVGDTTYAKGLALHSRTQLTYRLGGQFRQFKAVAGIDETVRPRGDVRLELTGDGKILWNATIKGTQPATQLNLDVTGVRRLEILVDFGGDLDLADYLNLYDARVIK